MRLNKKVLFFSIIVSVITIYNSIILTFFIVNNTITEFITNVSLNIFAGTIILIVTSLFDYFIQRKRILEQMMKECRNIIKLFESLEYYQQEDVDFLEKNLKLEEEELYKKLIGKKIKNKDLKNDQLIEEKKVNFKELIQKYLNIVNYDLSEFWDLYLDLDFINSDKKKEKFYYEFFEYINKKIEVIHNQAIHLRLFLNAKNGNFLAILNIIQEMQKEFFYYEEHERIDNDKSEWNRKLNNDSEYSYGYNNKKVYLIQNDISIYLRREYEVIRKEAYFESKK